jgi:hypothetical protein
MFSRGKEQVGEGGGRGCNRPFRHNFHGSRKYFVVVAGRGRRVRGSPFLLADSVSFTFSPLSSSLSHPDFSANYILQRDHRDRRRRPIFPRVRPHAPNTMQTPAWEDLSFFGRIKLFIWSLSRKFSERNVKFAIKTGGAAAILAAPSFFEGTRPWFMEYQGDWALISVGGAFYAVHSGVELMIGS